MLIRALTWNLYHGRDFPPDRRLRTWRSRLLRVTERGTRHAQVNRPLRDEFTQVLARLDWDVAFLQEAPPRWLKPLCVQLGASGASALTSRNFGALGRAALAALNPDLIASNEGGSNQLLVRTPWRIEAIRRATIARRPERRRMLWARVRAPDGRALAVANVHGSVDSVRRASDQVIAAAARAVEWADGLPLIFGGDLNLRPTRQPDTFAALERRFGLAPPTAPDAIDHLLMRGLAVVEPPGPLPPAVREVRMQDGFFLQLSDHPLVASVASMK